MLKIFKAGVEHLDLWLPIAEEFYDEGFDEYKWGFNKEHASATYKLFIINHICYLAEFNGEIVGCLAGCVSEHHFNYNFKYFQESMWYVKKGLRGKGIATALLEAVKVEAKERGCERFVVGHTDNIMPAFMKKFYQQLGFKLFETHYIKDL